MSGILAVVAAGLLRTWEQNNWQLSTAQTQNTDFAVEGMVNSILNGAVFVIMGLNLPSIIKLASTYDVSISKTIFLGIILYLVLFGLRVFWFSSGIVPKKTNQHKNGIINGLLAGINGVHGTVTLMMALSIPSTVTGLAVDLRATIILITLTVVILSMLMPMLVTPLLLNAYPKTPRHHSEKQVIWQELVQDSLRRIESLRLSEDVQNYLRVLIVTQRKLPRVSQKKLLNLYRETDKLENMATQKLLQTNTITQSASEYHAGIIKREVMNQQLTPWAAIIYWWKVLSSTAASKQRAAATVSDKTLFQQQEQIELASYHKIMQYLLKQNSGSPEANILARIYVTRHDDTSTVEKVNQERFYMIQLFSSEIEYVRQQYWRNRLTLSESRSMIYDISLQQTIFIRRHFD